MLGTTASRFGCSVGYARPCGGIPDRATHRDGQIALWRVEMQNSQTRQSPPYSRVPKVVSIVLIVGPTSYVQVCTRDSDAV